MVIHFQHKLFYLNHKYESHNMFNSLLSNGGSIWLVILYQRDMFTLRARDRYYIATKSPEAMVLAASINPRVVIYRDNT